MLRTRPRLTGSTTGMRGYNELPPQGVLAVLAWIGKISSCLHLLPITRQRRHNTSKGIWTIIKRIRWMSRPKMADTSNNQNKKGQSRSVPASAHAHGSRATCLEYQTLKMKNLTGRGFRRRHPANPVNKPVDSEETRLPWVLLPTATTLTLCELFYF